jgi:hypothetical protein
MMIYCTNSSYSTSVSKRGYNIATLVNSIMEILVSEQLFSCRIVNRCHGFMVNN